MHARLWLAIDQIGIRPASRFEWKLVSSLEWPDLEPFLAVCPGRAKSVPDPDDPLENLVTWEKEDSTALLESQHTPAHREPIEISGQELRLYRADLNKLAPALAAKFNFTAQPVDDGPVHRIGIVQVKAQPQVAVLLFLPDDPVTSVTALHKVAERQEQTMLLLPSARWARALPSHKDSMQVRMIHEFLNGNEEDHLTTVIARTRTKPPKRKTTDALQVRQGDRWKEVKIILNPTTGKLHISIDKRQLEVVVWNPKKRTRRSTGATRAAEILGRIAVANPQVWRNPGASSADHETMRKGFQLLKKCLAEWVPIADGEPFEYDRETRNHRPRFSLEMKKHA